VLTEGEVCFGQLHAGGSRRGHLSARQAIHAVGRLRACSNAEATDTLMECAVEMNGNLVAGRALLPAQAFWLAMFRCAASESFFEVKQL